MGSHGSWPRLQQTVRQTRPGDVLFFSFSGYGLQASLCCHWGQLPSQDLLCVCDSWGGWHGWLPGWWLWRSNSSHWLCWRPGWWLQRHLHKRFAWRPSLDVHGLRVMLFLFILTRFYWASHRTWLSRWLWTWIFKCVFEWNLERSLKDFERMIQDEQLQHRLWYKEKCKRERILCRMNNTIYICIDERERI